MSQKFKIEKIPGAADYILKRIAEDDKVHYTTLAEEINTLFGLEGEQKVSYMAVKRFLDYIKRKEMLSKVNEEGSIKPLIQEFRERMFQLLGESQEVLEKAKETQNINHIIKAIEQHRRNLVSLIKYGETVIKTAETININYTKDIKVTILSFANHLNKILCPSCKKKVLQVLDSELVSP